MGNPQDQSYMGDLYALGECVTKNEKESAKWYLKAAE
jgi:TPR repeat protein